MSFRRLSSPSRRLALALAGALIASFSALQAQTVAPRVCTVRVTLLQVNDVYQFMPVDRGRNGGLARVSTVRKKIMRESPHTIFLMSGDTISPSVESITYQGRQMIDAWNATGLDFAVFGNHEFDFGPEVLRERISESRFKWLGANVVETNGQQPEKLFGHTPPFVLREFDGVKVGIFGLTLPETKTTSRPGPQVEFREVCRTAQQIIPQMRAAGAHTIVALTHLAMKEDKELARCAPEIDVIIGGHEHTLLQSLAGRTPIFKMTSDARELGRIDLHVNAATGKVESIDWEVIPINDRVADDPEFASVTAKYQAKFMELAARVGASAVPLDARSAANRTGETNVGSFVADAFRQATGADVALINGGSIRADTLISAGDLSLRDVLSMLPFGNQLVKLELTGRTIGEALEHGVAASGGDAEPGRFPQVSGLRYSFDTTLLPGVRLKSITVNGRRLDETKTYTLVTTEYLANGGDGYVMFKDARRRELQTKITDAGALQNAIAGVKSIAPQTDGRIQRLDQPPRSTPPCPAEAKED